MTAAGAARRRRAAVVTVAVGVAGLEAAALLVYIAVIVVRAAAGDHTTWLNVLLLCLVLLAWAVGLAVAARGLWAGHRWSRAPLVVAELLLLAVSVSMVQGGLGWVGWPLVVGAVAALGALFAPAMTELLGEPGP